MEAGLDTWNVVLVANSFNPSVFRETWLAEQGIIDPGSLKPGYIFSDQAAQLRTDKFTLSIMPGQLTFAPVGIEAQDLEPLRKVLLALPHTPWWPSAPTFLGPLFWRKPAQSTWLS